MTSVQEVLFPLWEVGDHVGIRHGRRCCRGRVTAVDDDYVTVDWQVDMLHPSGFLPSRIHEARLVRRDG